MSLSNLIRFQITLDETNGKLIFEDLTSYTGYTIKGLLRISRGGEAVYVGDGYTDNDFTSPDTTHVNKVKEIDLPIIKGVYTIEYKVDPLSTQGGEPPIDGSSMITISRSYNFQSQKPTMNVQWNVNYITSELTVIDNSTYMINTPSGSLVETSKTRSFTLRPPIGTPMGIEQIEDAPPVVTIGPEIYTTNYDLKIKTDLEYSLEKWGDQWWVLYNTQAIYIESFNVEFEDDCMAECLSCIRQVSEKLQDARRRSQRDSDYYERMAYDISFYYGLYQMYKTAGLDAAFACEKIKDILRKECSMDISPSKIPTLIPAIAGGTEPGAPGEPGTKWLSGTTVPLSGEGSVGDFYLKTNDGNVYKKQSVNNWGSPIMTLWVKGKRLTKTVHQHYTVMITDDVVFVLSATPPGVAVTLPAVVPAGEGREYTIKVVSLTHPAVIMPTLGTINGSSFYQFGTAGDSVHIVLRGTNWEII
jgi:hypothetical protein